MYFFFQETAGEGAIPEQRKNRERRKHGIQQRGGTGEVL